jgi:hypothetical protein
MLKLSKALLLVISSLSVVNSQVGGAGNGVGGVNGANPGGVNGANTGAATGVGANRAGPVAAPGGTTGATNGATTGLGAANNACSKITGSTECPDFANIFASVQQAEFDSLVKTRYNTLKSSLKGTIGTTCATYDSAFSNNVRYLKSYACSLVIEEQGCGSQSTKLCRRICTDLSNSISGIGCINENTKTEIDTKCNQISSITTSCIDSDKVEVSSCGMENQTGKTAYCGSHPTDKCCTGGAANIASPTKSLPVTTSKSITPTTQAAESKNETKNETKNSSEKKEKKGGFFSSITFYILIGIFVAVIGILAFFYYLGAKDEKEEKMRNLESGNDGDINQNNNYGTQTVEVNKTQNINTNIDINNNYNEKSPFIENSTSNNDPFADSHRVDPVHPYNTDYNESEFSNDYKNFNDLQNNVSYQNPSMVAAPVENPFDAPDAVIPESSETKLNKNMQELSKNFPADDMPVPSVVKMTSIETPQQGNTNSDDGAKVNDNDDDILKPSMVRLTNIETPVPTNTIPSEKDINIGDDILKPSMVTLTEIQTPQESSINNDLDKEDDTVGPKKAVVNMIDLKTPDSNKALNAGNLLAPSIMITNTDGKTTDANQSQADEDDQEEYSEMPEPRPFRCIHAYEPQIDDELRLDLENDIDVLYEYDDGWCWAINKTTGEQGACPMLCLKPIQEISGKIGWDKDVDVKNVPGRRESMLSNSFDPSRYSLTKVK